MQKSQREGELFFSSVSFFSIFGLGFQSFNFGQHLQVYRVALPVDLLLVNKINNPAGRFFTVFAISEFAVLLGCFFKTGKIGRQLVG